MDMTEIINKDFEEFQKDLDVRNKKLKCLVKFKPDEKIDKLIKELKENKVIL